MSVSFDRVVRFVYVGAKDGSFEPVRQTDRIKKLTYEDHESKADKLTLDVRNDDLEHLDSALWRQGNIVRVGWGYGGIVAPIRECVIDKVSGGLTLKVEASGGEVVHNKVHLENRRWENAKRSEVARDLAKEMGFTSDQMIIQDTEEVYPFISVATLTRTQFLKMLARREGYDYYIDFDGFHFHERDLAQKPQMVLRYRVGDPSSGLSDITTFSFDKGVDATKPGSIRVQGLDPMSKEEVDFVADNSTVDRVALGGAQVVTAPEASKEEPLAEKVSTAVLVPTTELTPTGMKRLARGLFKRVQLAAIELKVTARGRPTLLAKSNVRIEGLGPTLSGVYYVKSAKHNVGGSNYTMDLELARDATTMAVVPGEEALPGQGDGVATQASVNDSEPADPDTMATKTTSDGVEYVEPERVISLKLQET